MDMVAGVKRSAATPPHGARTEWTLAVLVAAAACLCRRDGGAFDEGELIRAAHELVPSHPPGQPVFSLLGHLVHVLPLGSVPWRASLCSTLGGGLVLFMFHRLLPQNLPWALRALAMLALALNPAWLVQSLRCEVYTWAAGFGLAAVGECARTTCAPGRATPPTVSPMALRAALWTGLAAGTHLAVGLVTLVTALGAFMEKSHAQATGDRGNPHVATTRAALTMVMAAVTLGITWALSHALFHRHPGDVLWQPVTDVDAWMSNLSGAAFHAKHDPTWSDLWTTTWGTLLFCGTATFVLLCLKPRAATSVSVVAGVVIASLTSPWSTDNPDSWGYLLLPIAMVQAHAVWVLWEFSGTHTLRWALAVLAVARPLTWTQAPPAVAHLDRGDVDHTLSFLHRAPPGAVVITHSDGRSAHTWANRHVRGARPDTVHLVQGLTTATWHLGNLHQHLPLRGARLRFTPPHTKDSVVRTIVRGAQDRCPVHLERNAP